MKLRDLTDGVGAWRCVSPLVEVVVFGSTVSVDPDLLPPGLLISLSIFVMSNSGLVMVVLDSKVDAWSRLNEVIDCYSGVFQSNNVA